MSIELPEIDSNLVDRWTVIRADLRLAIAEYDRQIYAGGIGVNEFQQLSERVEQMQACMNEIMKLTKEVSPPRRE